MKQTTAPVSVPEVASVMPVSEWSPGDSLILPPVPDSGYAPDSVLLPLPDSVVLQHPTDPTVTVSVPTRSVGGWTAQGWVLPEVSEAIPDPEPAE